MRGVAWRGVVVGQSQSTAALRRPDLAPHSQVSQRGPCAFGPRKLHSFILEAIYNIIFKNNYTKLIKIMKIHTKIISPHEKIKY